MRHNIFKSGAFRTAKVFLLTVAVLATGVMSTGCGSSDEQVKELLDPIDTVIEVAYCERGPIRSLSAKDAHVETDAELISFDKDGYIFEMYVSPGDYVKKGDVIASLTSADFEEIETLGTEIEELEKNNKTLFEYYEAEIELAKRSGEDYREYELTLEKEKALAELKLSQKKERYDRLKSEDIGYNYAQAPNDGFVLAVSAASSGSYVTAGTPVAAIEGNGVPHISCEFISEKKAQEYDYFYAIIHGKEYSLTYVPFTKDELAALSATGARPVSYFALDESEMNDEIKAGDFATVVSVTQEKEDVLLVPINSIYTDTSGNFVYILDGSKRERRDVVTGVRDSVNIEIVEGLSGGECVYVQ